jgi:hypothetical protein
VLLTASFSFSFINLRKGGTSMKQILTLFLIALLVSGCQTSPILHLSSTIDFRNHVSFSWANIDNAEGFEIRREGKLIGRTGPNETGYMDINTDKGLICENTYTYTVTPIGAGMEGATIPVTTGTCPPKSRMALVIGNSVYEESGKLNNPRNDAIEVDKQLKTLDFDVKLLLDQNRQEMQMAIEEFGQRLSRSQGEDIAFFYYSGHGYGAKDDANYLIPVNDKNLDGYNLGGRDKSKTDDDNAVSDKVILAQMDHHNKKGINIVVLDACRNNDSNKKLNSKGFYRAGLETNFGDYKSGVVVGLATAPGKIVPSSYRRYSLYTEKLITALKDSSSKPLKNMFRKVEDGVKSASKGKQTPETIFGSVGNNICLGICF